VSVSKKIANASALRAVRILLLMSFMMTTEIITPWARQPLSVATVKILHSPELVREFLESSDNRKMRTLRN
jgi:hypothetical protein